MPKGEPGEPKKATIVIGLLSNVVILEPWRLPKDQRSLYKQPCWLLTAGLQDRKDWKTGCWGSNTPLGTANFNVVEEKNSSPPSR